MPSEPLRWDSDGRDWPNRDASEFITALGMHWHVQRMGSGPALLLVHGTGATTHSWRGLMPLLAEHFSIIAPDLPGHGFTATPHSYRLSLPRMAQLVSALLQTIEIKPMLVIGHSAGAAILARMILDHHIAPQQFVSINGALLPLHGLPGHFFSPAAKLLAKSTLIPRLFAWRASDRAAVKRLINSTGSQLDETGIELYARLMRNPAHLAGVLNMMANWDLRPLVRDLAQLNTALTLLVGEHDHTIPAVQAKKIQALVTNAKVRTLAGLGHLAHEEQPQLVAELTITLAQSTGLLSR